MATKTPSTPARRGAAAAKKAPAKTAPPKRVVAKAAAKKAPANKPIANKPIAKQAAANGRRKAFVFPTILPPPRRGRQPSNPQKPIDLYYWPTPNGWKISIMLEECGLPYVMRPVDIGQGVQFEPSFLAIAPNNRMPAIVDPQGPSNKPIAIFESGAILQYLGRKTGKYYPKHERARSETEQWLFWQMGGLGPMAGQAHHFRQYARDKRGEKLEIPYAKARYTDEVHRLYGVMDTWLQGREWLAGDKYSIADMASWPWVVPWKNQGQKLADFPNLEAWFERVGARPAVQRGFTLGRDMRRNLGANDPKAKAARSVLFGQRARR